MTPTDNIVEGPGGPPASTPAKVAVLMAGEYANGPPTVYNTDFWYDTVLTYCMLKRNGFSDEDIHVLYGLGQDGIYVNSPMPQDEVVQASSSVPEPVEHYYLPPYCSEESSEQAAVPITDLAMTYPDGARIRNEVYWPQGFFRCLTEGCDASSDYGSIGALTGADFLFVWWKGHGGVSSSSPDKVDFSFMGYMVPASEVIDWVLQVPAGRRLLVFDTCYSGCLEKVQHPNDTTTVLFLSSQCDERSNRSFKPDVYHSVFSYWVDCTLLGSMPNEVSNQVVGGDDGSMLTVGLSLGGPLDQTFDQSSQATLATVKYELARSEPQTPGMRDISSLAAQTRLDCENPLAGGDATPSPTPVSAVKN